MMRSGNRALAAFWPVLLSLAGAQALPAATPTATEALSATGVTGGLAAHLGDGDGALETALAQDGKFLVHDLAQTGAGRDAARKAIRAAGLYGLASAEAAPHGDFTRLPYATNTVNLLVADLDALGSQGPKDAEIQRVLTPGTGVAYVKKGSWGKVSKPVTPGTDDWGMYDHGPDGNPLSHDQIAGPDVTLRWISGQSLNPSYNPGVRIAGGRLVHSELPKPAGNNRPYYLVGRDAFNGLPLWRKDYTSFHPNHDPLIAAGGRAYYLPGPGKPMVAADLATGADLVTFSQGATWPASVTGNDVAFFANLAGGKLLQAAQGGLYALDAASGAKAWAYAASWAYFPVVDEAGGKVFFGIGAKNASKLRWAAATLDAVVACDLATGKELWKSGDVAGQSYGQMIYYKGHLLLFTPTAIGDATGDAPGGMRDLDPATGKTRWYVPRESGQPGYYHLMARDTSFYRVTSDNTYQYSLQTGQVTRGDKSLYMYENVGCMRGLLTDNYIIAGETMFTGPQSRVLTRLQRPGCATGMYAANGLIYRVPTAFCTCRPMERAYFATSNDRPEPILPDAQRLEPGASLSTDAAGAFKPTTVPGPMGREWAENWIYEDLTASAAATSGDLSLTAVIHEHRVEARRGGNLVWSFTAGGRVGPRPPLVLGDKAYFGASDGYLYCLNLADGAPQWRFLAAPDRRRIVAYGQLESPWRVPNAVAYQGKICVSAGRNPEMDGGIYFFGLDPATGAIAWKTRFYSPAITFPANYTAKAAPAGWTRDGASLLNDELVSTDTGLFVGFRNWYKGRGGALSGYPDIFQWYVLKQVDPAWNGKAVDYRTMAQSAYDSVATVGTPITVALSQRGEPRIAARAGRPPLAVSRAGDGFVVDSPEPGQVRIRICDGRGRTLGLFTGEGRQTYFFRPGRKVAGALLVRITTVTREYEQRVILP